MANKKQNIDDLFQSYLKDDELKLDGTEWDAIYAELHPKKKKRFFIWWVWGIGALVLALLWFGFTQFKKWSGDSQLVEKQKIVLPQINKVDKANSKELDKTTVEKITSIVPKEKIDAPKTVLDLRKSKQLATISKTRNSTGSDGTSISDPVANSPSNTQNLGGEEHEINSVADDKTPLVPKQSAFTIPKTTLSQVKPDFSIARLKPILPRVQLPNTASSTTIPSNPLVSPWKIGGGFRIGAVTQSLNADIGLDDYLGYRNENEKLGLGFNLGLDLKYAPSTFYYQGGIHFQQLTLSQPSLRYQLYDSIYVEPIGQDPFWFYWNYRDEVSTQSAKPTYQSITIPLAIGKEWLLNQKLSLDVQGNINPGITIATTGDVASKNLGIEQLNRNKTATFGLAAGLGLGLNYKMTKNLELQYAIGSSYSVLNRSNIEGLRQRFGYLNSGFSLYYQLK